MSPLLVRTVFGVFGALLIVQTAKFSGWISLEEIKTLTDFDAMHVAGRMVWRGEIDQAYRFESMLRAQTSLGGGRGFLPWAYPPQYDLLVAPLGLLPLGLAYLVFTGGTLLAFLAVLHRLAGSLLPAVLVAIFPAVAVTIACGQNGFLTAALIGWTCLALERGKAIGGVPLGLMVIKPHLAAAFALYILATRRWRTGALAAAIVVTSSALATVVFGPGIWISFGHGLSEARWFLEEGSYPMYRMISSYAALRSLGVPAPAALALHGAVAVMAIAMVLAAVRGRMTPRQTLGITCLASLIVSPYAYDYDLPILGVAAALLMPDLIRLAGPRERAAIVVLGLVTCGWGLAVTTALRLVRGADFVFDAPTPALAPSLAGATLPLVAALVWRALSRDPGARRARAPLSEGGAVLL